MTLDASVTITALVSGVTSFKISSASISPSFKGAYSTVTPLLFRYSSGRSTELCSATVVTTLSPFFRTPQRAMFSASVQFLVKTVRS